MENALDVGPKVN